MLHPLALALLLAGSASAAKVEVLVQDKHGNPAKDAVVYVHEPTPGKHSAPEEPYIMDQVDKEFVPHVLGVVAGGKVHFPNKDALHHHLYSFSDAKKFEVPLYKGKPSNPVAFDVPGVVKVGCNIHDWMNGVIVVLPNPYFAVTDAKGAAVVQVPEGDSVELEVFHERSRVEAAKTRQTVALSEKAKASWKLSLKADLRKKKPASFSSY